MEQPNSFGEWVRRRRRSFDWTQAELARHVGCAVGTIRRIEADELRPSKQMAELFAQHLDLPPETRTDFVRFARGTLRGEFSLAHSAETSLRRSSATLASHDTPLPPVERPTGTVTFLFTDIEGSTLLWQRHPTAMSVAFARHHTILREAIQANRGYVFQIVGDAFCAAFASARQALGAALAAQRALRDESWGETGPIRVRMGLHTGMVELHAGDYTSGEYASGVTLSHCSRFLTCGHGGQVLLSQATYALVQNELPADTTLFDLGEHRLKDLIHPEHIYQLNVPDLACEFPPLKTLDSLPNNLPIQLTSFIGRENEIAQVKQLLARTRLLTLTGAGGCGKTRLAIQVAAEVLDADRFPNGVWLVELAPLVDPALVAQTIAVELGLREETARPVLERLLDYIREKRLLLILDNCEHLIETCAKLADTLARACPQVHILATSREALGIAGETPYRIPSLSLPPNNSNPETLTASESVRLFVDRAVTLVPSFAVTNQNALAVAQICQRLDGIPLALELAAARVKVLSVEQIATRLDDGFKLLTGGSRTALPRQQTLRALIDWSYSLLTEPECVFLRRLSVFAGGWTLEAAQAVCSCDPVCADDVLDLLARLVDKSLVLVESQGEAARYRMLETIRQYAREKLLDSEEGGGLRSRHLDYFVRWAEEVEPKLKSTEQLTWLKQLEMERDNLRAALEWSLANAVESGLRLAGALTWFWWLHTYYSEGWEWFEHLLACGDTSSPVVRVKALTRAAHLSIFLNDGSRGQALSEQALSLSHAMTDRQGRADSLFYLGLAMAWQDQITRALELWEESLVLCRDLRDQWRTALALLHIGSRLANFQEDYGRGLAAIEESLTIFSAMGDRWGKSLALLNLGRVARTLGDYTRAKVSLEEAMSLSEELGDKLGVSRALMSLGDIGFSRGDYTSAAEYYEKGLRLHIDFDIKAERGEALLSLALAKIQQGDFVTARSLTLDALHWRSSGWRVKSAAEYLAAFAIICQADSQNERAVRLFGAAEAFLESVHPRPRQMIRLEIERNITAAREQLGGQAFDAAWADGKAMTLEQAKDYALNTE